MPCLTDRERVYVKVLEASPHRGFGFIQQWVLDLQNKTFFLKFHPFPYKNLQSGLGVWRGRCLSAQSGTDCTQLISGFMELPGGLPWLPFTAGVRNTCTGTWTCGGTLCSGLSPDSAKSSWIMRWTCGEDHWYSHISWWRECAGMAQHFLHWKNKVCLHQMHWGFEMWFCNEWQLRMEPNLRDDNAHPLRAASAETRFWDWRWTKRHPSSPDLNPIKH